MWFVFPQLAGLGFSAMAQRFAIGSRAEAAAYSSTTFSDLAWSNARGSSWRQAKAGNGCSWLSGDMRLRSCMTCRRRLEAAIFAEAVAAFYPDGKDRATLEILETSRSL